MNEILVSVLLSVCPAPVDNYPNACMEDIMNCAVGKAGEIKREKIEECVKEYFDGE